MFIGRPGVTELQGKLAEFILHDPESTVRYEAALNLAHMNREALFECLEKGYGEGSEQRQRVVETVAHLQDAAVADIDFIDLQARLRLKWPLRRLRLKYNRAHINMITFFAALGGIIGAVIGASMGASMGGRFSHIPTRLIPASILVAGWRGFLMGSGTGFGLVVIEAMHTRRQQMKFSLVFSAAFYAGFLSIFAALYVDWPTALFGMFVSFITGFMSGGWVAALILCTRSWVCQRRRLTVRVLGGGLIGLGVGMILALGTYWGVHYYENIPGERIPVGAPYGFGIGFLVPLCITLGIEIAERKLREQS